MRKNLAKPKKSNIALFNTINAYGGEGCSMNPTPRPNTNCNCHGNGICTKAH